MPAKSINWFYLIKSLLGNNKAPFAIEEVGDELWIKGDDTHIQSIQSRLQMVLQYLSDSLSYSIKTNSAHTEPKSVNLIQYSDVPLPEDTLAAGKALLLNLFSRKLFTKVGIDPEIVFGEGAECQKRVLFSIPYDNLNSAAFLESLEQNIIAPKLDDFSLKYMRNVFKGVLESPNISDNSESEQEKKRARELIKECFGVLSRSKPPLARMFFNFGKLYDGLFPPGFIHVKENSDQSILKIKKSHLMEYLRHQTEGNLLFHIYRDTYDQTMHAKPIFLSGNTQKTPSYSMLLDRSGSMVNYFDLLKKHTLSLLNTLKLADSDASVRLVFFESETGPIAHYQMDQMYYIHEFITATPIGDDTKLFKTILCELENLLNHPQENAAIILFSDGVNTIWPHDPQGYLNLIQAKIQEFSKLNLSIPKVFALGFGAVDVNLMKSITEVTSGIFIHLKTIQDFDIIINYLSEITTKRQLMDFKIEYEMLQSRKTLSEMHFTIPIFENDSPQIPEISIPLMDAKSFKTTINGNEMTVIIDAPNVAEVNNLDKTIDKLSQALQIATNEKMSYTDRKKNIQAISAELSQYLPQDFDSSEKIYLNNILEEINQIYHEMKKAENAKDPAISASIISTLKWKLGYSLSTPDLLPSKQTAAFNKKLDCIDETPVFESSLFKTWNPFTFFSKAIQYVSASQQFPTTQDDLDRLAFYKEKVEHLIQLIAEARRSDLYHTLAFKKLVQQAKREAVLIKDRIDKHLELQFITGETFQELEASLDSAKSVFARTYECHDPFWQTQGAIEIKQPTVFFAENTCLPLPQLSLPLLR